MAKELSREEMERVRAASKNDRYTSAHAESLGEETLKRKSTYTPDPNRDWLRKEALKRKDTYTPDPSRRPFTRSKPLSWWEKKKRQAWNMWQKLKRGKNPFKRADWRAKRKGAKRKGGVRKGAVPCNSIQRLKVFKALARSSHGKAKNPLLEVGLAIADATLTAAELAIMLQDARDRRTKAGHRYVREKGSNQYRKEELNNYGQVIRTEKGYSYGSNGVMRPPKPMKPAPPPRNPLAGDPTASEDGHMKPSGVRKGGGDPTLEEP